MMGFSGGFRTLRAGLALLCSAMVLAACQKKDSPSVGPPLAIVVQVAPAASATEWSLPGQVAAQETTPLSFRVSGKILARYVKPGDAVRAGQAVAELDPTPYEQNLERASAQVKAAKQNVAFAGQQLERDTRQAKADLIARAQLEQSQNAHVQARAALADATQQEAHASDQLAYATLAADRDGVIAEEHAQTGQNVTAGQLVYTLAHSDRKDVIVNVPERLIHHLNIGDAAQVRLAALPGQTLDAHVREIAASADPASRTFRVRLALVAPDDDVRLGTTATVLFASPVAGSGKKGTPRFVIPATALFHDAGQEAVWRLQDDDTLQLQPVTVHQHGREHIVISGDVTADDRILARGVHTVAPGQQVRPVMMADKAGP